jgi:hypothetical protein
MAIGVVLALAITLGIVALLEALDTSVRGRHDLVHMLSTPPLAVLPWIETHEDRTKRIRRARFAWAGTAASVLLLMGVIHFLILPLNIVWVGVLRRLGVL